MENEINNLLNEAIPPVDGNETYHDNKVIIQNSEPNDNTMDHLNDKLNLIISELGIKDNSDAICLITDYILNPHKIIELISENDIYDLFIDNFKKKYLVNK